MISAHPVCANRTPVCFPAESLSSKQTNEQAHAAAKVGEANVHAAEADLAGAQANVRQLVELVSFGKVVAPFEGRITQRNISVGSLVTAGSGRYRATRVGRAAYARELAEEARRFTLVRSELREGINQILRLVTFIIPPAAALLVFSQLQSADLKDSVRGSVAGVGSMVPEGLVLLTSLAFALAVVRLGRRRVLVQELAAVEGLARVDVACLDKTGTLTEGVMEVRDVDVLAPELPVRSAARRRTASKFSRTPSVINKLRVPAVATEAVR